MTRKNAIDIVHVNRISARGSPQVAHSKLDERRLMRLPVWAFVPNLIGYARVALAFLGYHFALIDWRTTVGAYLLSQGLDAADGIAARMLGQSSDFGAVLDMVTDRASTACLCIVLGHMYPELILTLTGLIMLDSFSHWRAATFHAASPGARCLALALLNHDGTHPSCRFHMHASLKLGLGSHKECTNPLLRFYYRRPVLFLVCSGALRETFSSQRRARQLPRLRFRSRARLHTHPAAMRPVP